MNPRMEWNPHWRLGLWSCLPLAAVLIATGIATAQDEPRAKPREHSRAPSLSVRHSAGDPDNPKSISATNGLWNTAISLGLVIGFVALSGRWLKQRGFRGPSVLPVEAFEVLGKRVLDTKTTVHMVKCGNRILLLGAGPEGVRTLSEIDDKLEVVQLASICRDSRGVATATSEVDADEVPPPKTTSTNLTSVFKRVGLLLLGMSFIPLASTSVSAQSNRDSSAVRRNRPQAEQPAAERPRKVQPAAMEQAVTQVSDSTQQFSPQQIGMSLKVLALMTVFSLAPSLLMMTTSFVRFVVVLGLLRQAIGTPQGPPTQVMTAICLFLTFLVMSPVWQRCYDEGIRPYTSPDSETKAIDEQTAISRTLAPVREFMSQQIEKCGNADAVWMLWDFHQSNTHADNHDLRKQPENYDDVPFTVLAPAYLLSELKVGFLIGFQLFLPFLVIDLVVSLTLASLGLNMLPPSMVSLPFKLLLFVLIDGWFLTIGMLLESVRTV